MLWKNGDHCGVELEDGIIMDYVKDSFIIAVKDDVWQAYEISALQHHKIHLSFLYERICAIFMFTVEDVIETSDVSFDIHVCEDADHILSLKEGDCYSVEIYLIDGENHVCACRRITLSLSASAILKEAMQRQKDISYDEEGYNRALQKIQGVRQPFELVEQADFHEVF